MIAKLRPFITAFSILAIGFATNANAQEDAWRFQLTPYVWMTGLAGDVRPLATAPTISTSRSFNNVLDDLDGAFFMAGSARRDRLVLFGDITWASLSHESTLLPGVAIEGKLRQRSLTAAAGYQVVNTSSQYLDLLADRGGSGCARAGSWCKRDRTLARPDFSRSTAFHLEPPVVNISACRYWWLRS